MQLVIVSSGLKVISCPTVMLRDELMAEEVEVWRRTAAAVAIANPSIGRRRHGPKCAAVFAYVWLRYRSFVFGTDFVLLLAYLWLGSGDQFYSFLTINYLRKKWDHVTMM